MSLEEEIRRAIAKRTHYTRELHDFLRRELMKWRIDREQDPAFPTSRDYEVEDEATECLEQLDELLERQEQKIRAVFAALGRAA